MQSVYILMRIQTYKCEVPTAVSTTVSGYVPYKTSSGDKRRIHLQLLYASVYVCMCTSVEHLAHIHMFTY